MHGGTCLNAPLDDVHSPFLSDSLSDTMILCRSDPRRWDGECVCASYTDETSFAKDEVAALSCCFDTECAGHTVFDAWGWVNGPYKADDFGALSVELPIYAGAGKGGSGAQCSLDAATRTGTLTMGYADSKLTFTWETAANTVLRNFHLHIGCAETNPYPLQRKGKPSSPTYLETIARGQFQFPTKANPESGHELTIEDTTLIPSDPEGGTYMLDTCIKADGIYVIAHWETQICAAAA